jgi:hypothetical protein
MTCNVIAAIAKAQPGIEKYLKLMEQLNTTNVAEDAAFQRAYNGFYRVRQRSGSWYETYYGVMEAAKCKQPTFAETLDQIHTLTGRYEPSFSSKLVATLNPHLPVWDVHVLRNLGVKPPNYDHPARLARLKECYARIESWYQDFMVSEEGHGWVNAFNEQVADHHKLTDLKKIDFILWQTRD